MTTSRSMTNRSSDISSTPTLQFDDAFLVNSEDEDENNDSEAKSHPLQQCLSCIEKIRYFFQCSKKEGLDCSNVLFQEIQSIEYCIL